MGQQVPFLMNKSSFAGVLQKVSCLNETNSLHIILNMIPTKVD